MFAREDVIHMISFITFKQKWVSASQNVVQIVLLDVLVENGIWRFTVYFLHQFIDNECRLVLFGIKVLTRNHFADFTIKLIHIVNMANDGS